MLLVVITRAKKERRDTSSSPASFASAFRLISALNRWSVRRLYVAGQNTSPTKYGVEVDVQDSTGADDLKAAYIYNESVVREHENLHSPFSGPKALAMSNSMRSNPLPKLKLVRRSFQMYTSHSWHSLIKLLTPS